MASQPEIVAHHFTEAGLVEPAIDYWLKAGNRALSRSANAEAVKHLRTRDRADSIPGADRPSALAKNWILPGPRTGMAATEGDAAPETLRVFSHARDLLGDGGTRRNR